MPGPFDEFIIDHGAGIAIDQHLAAAPEIARAVASHGNPFFAV
jgi:hypothetical protein